MTTQFTVRQMLPTDRDTLREIIALSFSRFMGFFAFHSLLSEEGQVLVADFCGMAVGFAKLIDFKIGECKFGCILWIGVHPEFRRKGIAVALTNAGVQRLKDGGARKVFASSQRRNTAAHALLSRSGFKSMGLLELWRIFGGRVFQLYNAIWLAPGEIIFMHG